SAASGHSGDAGSDRELQWAEEIRALRSRICCIDPRTQMNATHQVEAHSLSRDIVDVDMDGVIHVFAVVFNRASNVSGVRINLIRIIVTSGDIDCSVEAKESCVTGGSVAPLDCAGV